MSSHKKIKQIKKTTSAHWVGDGFPVRTIFSYNDPKETYSPFLLLDYAGPYDFRPTSERRGVGEHPHRGFETVTIVYNGELEHRDSSGGGGIISSGDIQWMTAASGIVHEEFHSEKYSRTGGQFEMVQLWVNLPKKFKMEKPRYQAIKSSNVPSYSLENNAGVIRVIAGEFNKVKGPAMTYTPINLWDIRVKKGKSITFQVPVNESCNLFVLDGQIQMSDEFISDAEIVNFERDGNIIWFEVVEDSKLLFLGGEIIDEPVVGRGPFVMNTDEEIHSAFIDYQSGKMGRIERIDGSKI